MAPGQWWQIPTLQWGLAGLCSWHDRVRLMSPSLLLVPFFFPPFFAQKKKNTLVIFLCNVITAASVAPSSIDTASRHVLTLCHLRLLSLALLLSVVVRSIFRFALFSLRTCLKIFSFSGLPGLAFFLLLFSAAVAPT